MVNKILLEILSRIFFTKCLTNYTMQCIVLCVRGYCMDSQQKKGLIELMVLASLKFEDSYGYAINHDINEVMEVSESTLYPILRRLEKQTFVETYQTIYNSRVRKYYKITKEGLRRLSQSTNDFQEVKKIYDYILR